MTVAFIIGSLQTRSTLNPLERLKSLKPLPYKQNLESVIPYPRLFLMVWQGLLLLASNRHSSLMAHDEGWYAALALGMVKSGNWFQSELWGNLAYQKTLGAHWLIASSLSIFGAHEFAARLPSLVACLASVLLTNEIGSILLNRRAAFWGTLSLSVMFLWVQFGQLATQDIPMVSVELLAIWALLRAENSKQHRQLWGGLAGLTLGLGFWIKGFMVFLPAAALSPYLIGNQNRHRHLSNLGLYQGIILGLTALLGCLWRLWAEQGTLPFRQMFGTLAEVAAADYHGVGPFYYFWNIPGNTFPWGFFSLAGLGLVLQQNWLMQLWASRTWLKRRLLLISYPLCLFVMLVLFRTRTQYYALQLYPFIALFAGVALDILIILHWRYSASARSMPAVVSYGFTALGALLVFSAFALGFGLFGTKVSQITEAYVLPGVVLGVMWLGATVLWRLSRKLLDDQKRVLAPELWVGSLLLGPWLALAIAGYSGSLGDYNPALKAFLQKDSIANILQHQSIDFIQTQADNVQERKALLLLTFYTPHWGKPQPSPTTLAPETYAWMTARQWTEFQTSDNQPSRYRVFGKVDGWQLIQHP